MEKLKKQFELINSIDNQWVNIVKQYIKDSDVTKENRKILHSCCTQRYDNQFQYQFERYSQHQLFPGLQ